MCDVFTTRNILKMQFEPAENALNVYHAFYVNFVKSSMFKSKIKSANISESKEAWTDKLSPIITKFS
jgi:hypothetical protein